MKNTLKLIGFIFFFCTAVLYAQEKIYFDSLWAVTTKDKAVFYRETTPEKEFTRIKDFYKNGTLQMEGLASDTTPSSEIFEGKVTWYYPNGKTQIISNFSKGMPIGEQKSYDEKGRVLSDLFYRDSEKYDGVTYSYSDTYEYNYGNTLTHYKNGKFIKIVNFEKDPQKGIRSETNYQDYLPKEILYYNEKNKLIGKLTYEKDGYTTTGTEILYYYSPMRIKSILQKVKNGESVEEKSRKEFYADGKLKSEYIKTNTKAAQTIYYNTEGKIINKLQYAWNKYDALYPHQGTEIIFFDKESDSDKIQAVNEYKEGVLILAKGFNNQGKLINNTEYDSKNGNTLKTTQYNDEGVLIAQLAYRDGVPYDGVEKNEFAESVYKEGKLFSQKKYYQTHRTLHYERNILPNEDTYEVKVYEKDKNLKYQFLISSDSYDQFNTSVKIYENGKHKETAEFKDGILTKGRIKYPNYYGNNEELERQGDWLIKRTYSSKNELIKEFKEKVLLKDDNYSVENVFYETKLYEIYEQ